MADNITNNSNWQPSMAYDGAASATPIVINLETLRDKDEVFFEELVKKYGSISNIPSEVIDNEIKNNPAKYIKFIDYCTKQGNTLNKEAIYNYIAEKIDNNELGMGVITYKSSFSFLFEEPYISKLIGSIKKIEDLVSLINYLAHIRSNVFINNQSKLDTIAQIIKNNKSYALKSSLFEHLSEILSDEQFKSLCRVTEVTAEELFQNYTAESRDNGVYISRVFSLIKSPDEFERIVKSNANFVTTEFQECFFSFMDNSLLPEDVRLKYEDIFLSNISNNTNYDTIFSRYKFSLDLIIANYSKYSNNVGYYIEKFYSIEEIVKSVIKTNLHFNDIQPLIKSSNLRELDNSLKIDLMNYILLDSNINIDLFYEINDILNPSLNNDSELINLYCKIILKNLSQNWYGIVASFSRYLLNNNVKIDEIELSEIIKVTLASGNGYSLDFAALLKCLIQDKNSLTEEEIEKFLFNLNGIELVKNNKSEIALELLKRLFNKYDWRSATFQYNATMGSETKQNAYFLLISREFSTLDHDTRIAKVREYARVKGITLVSDEIVNIMVDNVDSLEKAIIVLQQDTLQKSIDNSDKATIEEYFYLILNRTKITFENSEQMELYNKHLFDKLEEYARLANIELIDSSVIEELLNSGFFSSLHSVINAFDKKVHNAFEESLNINLLDYLRLSVKNFDIVCSILLASPDKFKQLIDYFGEKTNLKSVLGVELIDRVAIFINNYPELSEELFQSPTLSPDTENKLIYLFYGKKIQDIKTVTDLDNLDSNIDKAINIDINSENISPVKLKDTFLIYFANITYADFKKILDYTMDIQTLDRLLSRPGISPNDRMRIQTLHTYISFLNETINSISDIESLKEMLKLIDTKEKRNKFSKIYQCFSNINEYIRQLYEIDVNNTLTNLSNLPKSLYNESGYYDLSECQYTLYAHVTTCSAKDLVTPRLEGHPFICLTPISDLMVKGFYSAGVVVLYDKVPSGSFIGSSTRNAGSNDRTDSNDYDMSRVEYHQTDILTSSKTVEYGTQDNKHSETDVFRSGMIPAAVLVRGTEPTDYETAYAAELSELLGREIPLIKVQEVGKKIENPKSLDDIKARETIAGIVPQVRLKQSVRDIISQLLERLSKKDQINEISNDTRSQYLNYINEWTDKLQQSDAVEEYQEVLQHLQELMDSLDTVVKKDRIVQIKNDRYRTGASHDFYSCKVNIDGQFIDCFLKPGIDRDGSLATWRVYSNRLGYEMQALINPEGAIRVEVGPANLIINGKEQSTLCAAVARVPNVTDFESWDENPKPEYAINLNEGQISSLMQELVVDYLIFNYDTKGANFITDGSRIYGVDKEQSLKNALTYPDTIEGTVNRGNTATLYKRVLDAHKQGYITIPDTVFEAMIEKAKIVADMDDEKYLEMFETLINCHDKADRDALVAKVLARKHNVLEQIESLQAELSKSKGR